MFVEERWKEAGVHDDGAACRHMEIQRHRAEKGPAVCRELVETWPTRQTTSTNPKHGVFVVAHHYGAAGKTLDQFAYATNGAGLIGAAVDKVADEVEPVPIRGSKPREERIQFDETAVYVTDKDGAGHKAPVSHNSRGERACLVCIIRAWPK